MDERKVEAVIIPRSERERKKQEEAQGFGWALIPAIVFGLLAAANVIGPY